MLLKITRESACCRKNAGGGHTGADFPVNRFCRGEERGISTTKEIRGTCILTRKGFEGPPRGIVAKRKGGIRNRVVSDGMDWGKEKDRLELKKKEVACYAILRRLTDTEEGCIPPDPLERKSRGIGQTPQRLIPDAEKTDQNACGDKRT